MKGASKILLGLVMVFALVLVARAEDEKEAKKGKEVTLKGTLGCAKCVFKVDGIKKCTNAIKVKEAGKEVVYLLDDKGNKEKYHRPICTDTKPGSVKGVVYEKEGQKYIKPAKNGVKYED